MLILANRAPNNAARTLILKYGRVKIGDRLERYRGLHYLAISYLKIIEKKIIQVIFIYFSLVRYLKEND